MRRAPGLLVSAALASALACGGDGTRVSDSQTSTTGPGPTTTEDDTSTPTSGTSTSTGTTASPTSTGPGPTTGPGETTVASTTESVEETASAATTVDDTSGPPCEEQSVTLKPTAPNTMLVLDKSGSMLSFWDHDADVDTQEVTRWHSLFDVVQQVVTAFDGSFNFGANLFPSTDAVNKYESAACVVDPAVEVPVAVMNSAAIIAAIPAQDTMAIKGATPSGTGISVALSHLKGLDPAVPRIVMLITDGAANSGADAQNPTELFEQYDPNLPALVDAAWQDDGIPTYVIGIAPIDAVFGDQVDSNPDGINPHEKLNELATLGGRPRDGAEKFYSADNQIELSAALAAVVGDAMSCVIPLASEPAFPDKTVVKVDGQAVPKVSDCAAEDGWVYVQPDPPFAAIELCGTACAGLKAEGSAEVEYFCEAG